MIRNARLTDAPELADLSGQLGYPSTGEQLRDRLASLLERRDDLVLLAVDEGDRAVGWIHAAIRRQLELDPFVQIASLVVARQYRGSGIGVDLLSRAEEWARRSGVEEIHIRSNVVRERAHAFYLREGYRQAKTSHLFVKRRDDR